MKRRWRIIIPAVSIFLCQVHAYADAEAYVKPAFSTDNSDLAYSIAKLVSGLILFSLILVGTYYATRFFAKKGTFGGRNKHMKIIETLPLGVDKCIYLVQVGEQYFLLGGTQKNVNMLSPIDRAKLSELDETPLEHNNYSGVFENIISKYRRKDSVESYSFQNDDTLSSTKTKLSNLKSMVRGNRFDE